MALLWLALGCQPYPSPVAQLNADALFGYVGESLEIRVQAAEGDVFSWDFGDGNSLETNGPDAQRHTWAEPGHYPVYFASQRDGEIAQSKTMVYITHRPAEQAPRHASSIQALNGSTYVVMPDFDAVAVLRDQTVHHIPTCARPTTLSVSNDWLAVACPGDDQLRLHPLGDGQEQRVQLPHGSRPYGVVLGDNDTVYASCRGPAASSRGASPRRMTTPSIPSDPTFVAWRY